jgi:hypothetical protein
MPVAWVDGRLTIVSDGAGSGAAATPVEMAADA